MNKEKRFRSLTGITFAVLIIFSVFSSCKKDAPTRAIITVIDSNSRPVVGAKVTLWQDTAVNQANGVTSNVRISKNSDAAGKAQFEFQLEAFLNVEVIYLNDTGKSFLRLKENETVEQTVRL